jgi:hypothetical protein
VRFYNVELERRTAAKVLQKDSSQSPRNLTSMTVVFALKAFAIIALPQSGVRKGAFIIKSDISD